ncbi:GNAT family N-acetyltransferase [Bradyrhizobium oligotrophicum S58]
MSKLELSAEQRAALDRPVWSALTTGHRAFAEGAAQARRYPAAIAPFAAMSDDSDAAWSELADLANEDVVAIVTPAPPGDVRGLDARLRASVRQMVAVGAVDPARDAAVEVLDQPDIPAMLELTALTKPGPFLARTHELGRYIGIRDGGAWPPWPGSACASTGSRKSARSVSIRTIAASAMPRGS